ncbi:MAG: methyl-accepting chemotaxis protein [Treponema sp.]|jgi:methyl-accepting chemotaxis protein|nr:methyl-accepting chemotaxis protein [Treponema sp.]
MKLSVKIPLLIGLLVFLTCAGLGIAALLVASNVLETEIRETLQNEANTNANVISITLQGQLEVLQELANRARTKTMDWDTVRSSLTGDVERIGYLDLALVYPDGTARYILSGSTGGLGDRDYIKTAFSGKPAVSDVIISRVINRPVIMYAVPVTDASGTVVGVLVGRKDGGETMSKIISMIKISMSTGYGYLVGRDGTFAAHANMDLVLSEFNPIKEAEKDPSLAALANTITLGLRERNGSSIYNYQGKELVSFFTEIPGFSWLLFISIERAEFTLALVRLRLVIFSLSAAFVVIGVVLSAFIGRSIAKPIRGVAATLRDISEGEGDLTHHIHIDSKDEIWELGHYFNLTLEKIKNMIVTIKNDAVNLSDIGSELASNMTQTAAAINEITANIQSIKGRVINQSASVTQTNATMEQITVNIDKLNGHVEKQTASVSKSSSAIEEMLANINSVTSTLAKNAQNVEELLEASEVGRTGLQDVAADIQTIARESEGLLEINAVMENIASQTNLLSMNAAIEAAHAGEAGKGFAVVADEIRKLAEGSSEQSKTISGVLKKIKDSIDKITRSTNAVLEKFEAIDSGVKTVSEQTENIRGAMEEQSAGSRQILEVISQLNEITRLVKGGSEEMLEGSKEVITEGKNLEMVTSEITNGVNEMASGADQINAAVTQVNEISGQNRDTIDSLVREVSRFKVE